jgi:hypothetical protein
MTKICIADGFFLTDLELSKGTIGKFMENCRREIVGTLVSRTGKKIKW